MPQVVNVSPANIRNLTQLIVKLVQETNPRYIQLVVDYQSFKTISTTDINSYLNKLAIVIFETLHVPLCSFGCHLCSTCVKIQPESSQELVDKHGYITQDMKNQFYRSIHEVLKGDC